MATIVAALTMCVWFMSLLSTADSVHGIKRWPGQRSTRFYDFKVQTKRVTKLCNTKDIVTINEMFPGPVVYAQEDDRVVVRVTNQTPFNITIHWHGVRQRLSCWFDGPSYVTQCPIQGGRTFTYNFTMAQQKGTMLWHAHASWLRATVHGAIVVYPKPGVPYPFPYPYEEHILILGEYWVSDVAQLEDDVLASGGSPPIADAYTINGQPGPNYNCSINDVYKISVVPGKTYMLRLINAALNSENFFAIADHNLTIVEADAEYTKPFTTSRVMLGPGQTLNVLVTANQPPMPNNKPLLIYPMAMGPYMSAQNVPFQNTTSIAHFQYVGPAAGGTPINHTRSPISPILPSSNDHLAVKTTMDGLRSLGNTSGVPRIVDKNLFVTIGLNVQKCDRENPARTCRGVNGGIMSASMNNVTFSRPPNISILEAHYYGYSVREDFPEKPLRLYDFVKGAPNDAPNDTGSVRGGPTRVHVIEYGSRVQVVLQDTGTVSVENHPVHLHGYSFYVVGYGSGDYDPEDSCDFNLLDPPYMNTIGVPVGGWAAIRFTADNPGAWFMHCHLEIHLSWGLSVVFVVKNGEGPLETLPNPPADYPLCC